MEETKYLKQEYLQDEEEKSSFDIKQIYTILVLNWKWFVLSIIICLGVAYIYLRYTTPIYQAQAKLLIKDETQSRNRGNSIMNTSNLGIISNSTGIDNEMEILSSCNLAQQAVTDLKLYVTYRHPGHIKDATLYRNQEINVDMDLVHLKKLCAPIQLNITREGNNYHVTGTYYMPAGENTQEVTSKNINRTFNRLPAMIGTRVGIITLTQNEYRTLADGQVLEVTLSSPVWAAGKYAGSLTVSQTSKTTTIAQLVLSDEFPQRAIDYLKQLAIVYNRQANEDKNLIAVRTEQFINNRLEKINAELGNTEGELENFKKRNQMVELKINATQAVSNADEFSKRGWEDELIGATPPPAVINEQPSEISQLIAKTKAEQERNTDEVKNQALRQRIFGMIEILEKNPKSFCKSQLEIYRDNGTLERLGIEWNSKHK